MSASYVVTRILVCAVILLLSGCGRGKAGVRPSTSEPIPQISARFTDITRHAGIQFIHHNGAFGGRLLPETIGAGLAFLDYDGDLDPDLFVVNGRDWTQSEVAAFKRGGGAELSIPERISQKGATCRLYQNNGDGTFTDVTAGSGIETPMFGMGAAVGDYDNDGDPDLFVTAVGKNFLFRNVAPGKFVDVSNPAGVVGSGWATGAAFLDYDRDGKLDLFVCRYVKWSPDADIFTSLDGKSKAYLTPEQYVGESCRLYRNVGGKFKDVSAAAGISVRLGREQAGSPIIGKSLGVAITDTDSDGWPDIVVTNDTEPNFLFRNNGQGGFEEMGAHAGIAFAETGSPRSGRGVDSGDLDGSGTDSLFFTCAPGQPFALYRNEGARVFADSASQFGIASTTAQFSGFGAAMLDVDNDGRLDVMTVNGHLEPDIETYQPDIRFAQRPLFFWNRGNGFVEVGSQLGADFTRAIAGRGLAHADIDLDGDLDLAITSNGGSLYLFRNQGVGSNSAVRLVLTGSKSNRNGIGAVVALKLHGRTLRRTVRSGSSYLSQSEIPLTVGLGTDALAESMTITWPSGATTSLENVLAGQILQIKEGVGLEASLPFYRPR